MQEIEKMIEGIKKLGYIAEKTLGPMGGSVLLDKGYNVYNISNDGYEIAKVINPDDAYEACGMVYLKNTAKSTKESVGKGSTLSMVLCKNIIVEAVKNIAAGANPIDINRELIQAMDIAIQYISDSSKNVSDAEELFSVICASETDEEILEIMKEVINYIEKGKSVILEERGDRETYTETVSGLFIDNGYISPYYAANKEYSVINLYEPFVLLTEKVISDFEDLLPVLEKVKEEGKSLLILAADVTGDALANLLLNSVRKNVNAVAVRAGSFGISGSEILEDAAVVTGGHVISADLWDIYKNDYTVLGIADRIEINSKQTKIIPVESREKDIENRLIYLQSMTDNTADKHERNHYLHRMSRLEKERLLIKVGGCTDTEIKYKRSLIEKELSEAKNISESGMCSGAGITYLRCAEYLRKNCENTSGRHILSKALTCPLEYIVSNAGYKSDEIVYRLKNMEKNVVFDIHSGEYVNAMDCGIVDSAAVLTEALRNAVSSASMFLSTSSVLVENQKN